MGRKKARTPAQQIRAKYLEANGLRGSGNANIWVTTCPRSGEDLVFVGDARIEHFYACEGDPSVVCADYRVEKSTGVIKGNSFPVQFDARVELTNGQIEYRVVGSKAPCEASKDKEIELQACVNAAERLGGRYRPILLSDLDGWKQRTNNWRRAMRFLRACKHHPLGESEGAVCAQLQQHGNMAIGQLLANLPHTEESILVGVIVRLLHKRALVSDLDQVLFSKHTILRLPGSNS